MFTLYTEIECGKYIIQVLRKGTPSDWRMLEVRNDEFYPLSDTYFIKVLLGKEGPQIMSSSYFNGDLLSKELEMIHQKLYIYNA